MSQKVFLDLHWLDYGIIATTGIAVFAILWMLVIKPHVLHPVKRIGLGLIGSGLLMNLGALDGSPTPFSQWTTILARMGVICLILGYYLDKNLAEQLRRLDERRPRHDTARNTAKVNVLRQAAWAENNKERKVVNDGRDDGR